jgi:phosphoribosyl 1,2-cyclic phosphodiesterase
MGLHFCSFSSGSSGNCGLVFTETTGILIDAGIPARRVWQGFTDIGFSVDRLKGLLITHEHSDHARCIDPVAGKKKDLPIYANEKTWTKLTTRVSFERRQSFTKQAFSIGDIEIEAFDVSHDAIEPVGFSFSSGGRQISLMTDTGCIPEFLPDSVLDADLLILEANHDVNLLRVGRYPWFLKQRIMGEQGHLSNEAAGFWLVDLLKKTAKKERVVLLAHLSSENNFPQLAWQTVKNILEDSGLYLGDDLVLETIVRNVVSPIF